MLVGIDFPDGKKEIKLIGWTSASAARNMCMTLMLMWWRRIIEIMEFDETIIKMTFLFVSRLASDMYVMMPVSLPVIKIVK